MVGVDRLLHYLRGDIFRVAHFIETELSTIALGFIMALDILQSTLFLSLLYNESKFQSIANSTILGINQVSSPSGTFPGRPVPPSSGPLQY